MSEQPYSKEMLPKIELPTQAQTAERWRSLIFSQLGVDPKSMGSVDDVACWAMIVAVDLDVIEELIRRIALYGVIEAEGGGGSGQVRVDASPEHSEHRC